MTTFNGVPLSLANYEGSYRYAYVVDGRGTCVPGGSRAVWFAKQAERRYKSAEVWYRDNSGNWQISPAYDAELKKQVAKLLPYDSAVLAANPKLKSEMYEPPKGEVTSSARPAKTGLQAALSDLSVISRTLSRNMAEGFVLTVNDFSNLEKSMLTVMELTQVQGPAEAPAQ